MRTRNFSFRYFVFISIYIHERGWYVTIQRRCTGTAHTIDSYMVSQLKFVLYLGVVWLRLAGVLLLFLLYAVYANIAMHAWFSRFSRNGFMMCAFVCSYRNSKINMTEIKEKYGKRKQKKPCRDAHMIHGSWMSRVWWCNTTLASTRIWAIRHHVIKCYWSAACLCSCTTRMGNFVISFGRDKANKLALTNATGISMPTHVCGRRKRITIFSDRYGTGPIKTKRKCCVCENIQRLILTVWKLRKIWGIGVYQSPSDLKKYIYHRGYLNTPDPKTKSEKNKWHNGAREKNQIFSTCQSRKRMSREAKEKRNEIEKLLSKQLNELISAVSMTNSTETKAISSERRRSSKLNKVAAPQWYTHEKEAKTVFARQLIFSFVIIFFSSLNCCYRFF